MYVIVWGDTKDGKGEQIFNEMCNHGIDAQIIKNPPTTHIKRLVNKIRENRDKLNRHRPKNGWKFEELSRFPILEIENNLVYPAFYLENMGILGYSCLLNAIKDKQLIDEANKQQKKTTLKLKINKNKWKPRETTTSMSMSLESVARVNITTLRLINGVDIYEIMKGWSEKEKAAATILWRLAQHNKGNDMRLIAEMLTTRAKLADPYAKHDDRSDM